MDGKGLLISTAVEAVDPLGVQRRRATGQRHPHRNEPLLEQLADHWRGSFAQVGPPLRLNSSAMQAAAYEAAVRQVLEVRIGNAYRHGRGSVTITAHDSNGAVAVDVADQGDNPVPWPPGKVVDGSMGP